MQENYKSQCTHDLGLLKIKATLTLSATPKAPREHPGNTPGQREHPENTPRTPREHLGNNFPGVFSGCSRGVLGVFSLPWGVPEVFRKCSRGVLEMFSGCSRCLGVFRNCSRGVLDMFSRCSRCPVEIPSPYFAFSFVPVLYAHFVHLGNLKEPYTHVKCDEYS